MIKRLFLLPFAALVFTASAHAETVSIEPGLWDYEYAVLLGGIPLGETGKECVAADEATVSLQSAAKELNENCSISSISSIENGYAFTLTCTGDMPGEASGKVISTGDGLNVSVSGTAGPGDTPLPFRLDARATRAGTC